MTSARNPQISAREFESRTLSIPELEAQRRKIHEVFSKADAALHNGTIGQPERDRILMHYYGTANEQHATARIDAQISALKDEARPAHKVIALVAGFAILMLSLFGMLLYSTGGITGAVILNVTEINSTYESSASIPIMLDGTTRLNISGMAAGVGDAIITLNHDGQQYLLYEYHTGTISTSHASMQSRYVVGEQVSFTATNLSSAYLMTAEDAVPLDGTTIDGLAPGNYTLKLIINDTGLSQETLQFEVIEADAPAPIAEFNTCGEACSINLSGPATIDITLSGTTVTMQSITLATKANNPPLLQHEVADAAGTGSVSIDLTGVFADADGDALIYDSTHHTGNTELFDGNTFTVSGAPGTYTYMVYASDMVDLTPSNIFTITIEAAPSNATNETANSTEPANDTETLNETAVNVTLNETLNETAPLNVTGNETGTLDCSNPDPNSRPLECIQNASSTYFRPEEILLENKDGIAVGKLTPIGNLLIKGTIIEHSTATPGARDWVRGYKDENGEFVPTVWISDTGDLHMRGSLTEANANIVFEPGLYAFLNDRDIILALVNMRTGDLTVRGNVIPYRRSFA